MADHLALIHLDPAPDPALAMVAGIHCCGRKVTPSITTESVDPMHPVNQILRAVSVKIKTSFTMTADRTAVTEVADTTRLQSSIAPLWNRRESALVRTWK